MDEEKKTQKITFQIRERKGSDYRVPPGIFEGIPEDKQKELQKLEQESAREMTVPISAEGETAQKTSGHEKENLVQPVSPQAASHLDHPVQNTKTSTGSISTEEVSPLETRALIQLEQYENSRKIAEARLKASQSRATVRKILMLLVPAAMLLILLALYALLRALHLTD